MKKLFFSFTGADMHGVTVGTDVQGNINKIIIVNVKFILTFYN